jgi:eukaryotic-like serine/threonine-protein kinase
MEPGRVIAGKFRLTRQLGQGGMGSVWGAVHETLGREVAVKFLHPQTRHVASMTERFVSEARMAASIKHRFVIDVFDFGVTEDNVPYMVLELLHGTSLAQRMDYGPPFGVRQAVQLLADCLRGVQAVHDAGIIHRDLKPDNIFVIEDADGVFPKLIDFGISKRTETAGALDAAGTPDARRSRLTQPGTVVGTPYYMSPEQLRGRQNLDQRSDVYSVGVMSYELLTGRLPFAQDNIGDLMVAITLTGAPSLNQLRPELGSQLAEVIARALSPKPEQRYPTALALREALLATLPGLPDGARSMVQTSQEQAAHQLTNLQLEAAANPFLESSLPLPLVRPIKHRRWLWLAALASVFVLALGLWFFGGDTHDSAAAPFQVVPAPVRAPVAEVEQAPVPEQPEPAPEEPTAPPAELAVPATAATPLTAATISAVLPPEAAPEARPAPRLLKPTHVHGSPNRLPFARAHTSNNSSPKPAEPSQRLYRKLDF